jgi:uncharacterized alpha-E superfamily protein
VISRVASHCFWLGRYLERAESSARVLLVTRNLALDSDLAPRQVWAPVIVVSGEEARYRARFGDGALEDPKRVQHHLTWDEETPSSIVRSVAAARENARWIRDVVSLETWEALNELHLWLRSDAGREEYDQDRHAFFRRIRQATQMVVGVMHATMMIEDDALDIVVLGLMLERSGQTARILDVHHHAFLEYGAHHVVETAHWLSLLRACSGFEPFMKRQQGAVTPLAVARFLVMEPRFPRSVRFCLAAAYRRLARIRPPSQRHLPGAAALERLRGLQEEVERSTGRLEQGGMHHLLTHVVDEGAAICNVIGQELLGSAPTSDAPAAPQ